MLHEVLLALSGHPSPLFDDTKSQSFPLLTPAEHELLTSIGHLANVHRCLKDHVAVIVEKHPSAICRAVAGALQSRHLAAFQRAILDVEAQILSSDSAHVGAYNIVPLADVVSSFNGWRRRLEWYWDLATFILPPDAPMTDETAGHVNGPAVINILRQGLRTGYPDIEDSAVSLVQTAERTWLRLLSTWLLKGSLEKQAVQDLFVKTLEDKFVVVEELLPDFVSPAAAASVLYIGNTLNHIAASSSALPLGHIGDSVFSATGVAAAPVTSRTQYVKLLSPLRSPISPAALANVVTDMRSLLSQQLTTTVLPMEKLVDTVATLKDFFLLQKGNFADTLITQADGYLHSRSEHLQGQAKAPNSLAGIVMRDAEAGKVLSNTWASMSAALGMSQAMDPQIEWARDNVLLRVGDNTDVQQSDDKHGAPTAGMKNIFASALLSTPSTLTLKLKSPLDLFLSPSDVKLYSLITAYLIAIRRSMILATNLWKHNDLRKGASAGASNSRAGYTYRLNTSRRVRERARRRERSMRMVWATLTSAIFFLTELGEYLNKEVVTSSWLSFQTWFGGKKVDSRDSSRPGTATSAAGRDSVARGQEAQGATPAPSHDPELLSLAHRQYLHMLLETLLLTKDNYARAIHTLLARIDQLVAFVLRLQGVQSKLDLHDEGVDDGFADRYAAEEREVYADMTLAADKVKYSLRYAIEQLQAIDAEVPSLPAMPEERARTGFQPWNGGSIDHLLLRLDLKMSNAGGALAT